MDGWRKDRRYRCGVSDLLYARWLMGTSLAFHIVFAAVGAFTKPAGGDGSYRLHSITGMAVIPILAHPYVPDGTVSILCETVPYPNAREGRGWTLETLRPYTYIPLANLTDHIPFELAADELLECNHPSAQGQVYGIDVS